MEAYCRRDEDHEQHLGTVEKMAKDRQKWRTFVAALHANGISGSKKVYSDTAKKRSRNLERVCNSRFTTILKNVAIRTCRKAYTDL